MEIREIDPRNERVKTFLDNNPLLLVQSEDPTALIALHARLQMSDTIPTIFWWDTNKERAKKMKEILDTGENGSLAFLDDGQVLYSLKPMTLDMYRSVVKPVIGGPDFETVDAIIRAFEDTAY